MRVYHFLSAANALDDLRRRKIKLSEIDKLNDPFELWCAAQEDPVTRLAMRSWKEHMTRTFGMLCFCRSWHNPVLWSHYADRHRGVCLGIDVSDERLLRAVRYVRRRTALPIPPGPEAMDELLFTKYQDWSYEQEVRGWFKLEERDPTGYYFYDFDDKLRLREVIAGPLCPTPRDTIEAAIKDYEQSIDVIRARLAFRSFKIVQNKQGFAQLEVTL